MRGRAKPGAFRFAAALVAGCLIGGCLAGGSGLARADGPTALFPDLPAPADAATGEPLPPLDEGIGVEELGTVGLDSTAVPDPIARVLGPSAWAGDDAARAAEAIRSLKLPAVDPGLRRLARGVLAIGAPIGDPDGGLLELRVRRLLDSGDVPGAAELLAGTGDGGGALEQLAIEVALDSGNSGEACAKAGPDRPAEPFWTQLRVFCLLRDGKRDAARVLVELAGEEQGPFWAAARRMIEADGGGRVETGPLPDALAVAMAEIARVRLLPTGDADAFDARLLKALANGRAASTAAGLDAAGEAALRGLVGIGELRRQWLRSKPDDAEGETRRRIEALQAVDRAGDDPARAAALVAAWHAEPKGPFRPVWAELLAPWQDPLPPGAAEPSQAIALAALALAAGRTDRAGAWAQRNAAASSPPDGRGEHETERLALWLALAGEPVAHGLPASPEDLFDSSETALLASLGAASGLELGPAWNAVVPTPFDDAPAVVLARAVTALDAAFSTGEAGEAGSALATLDLLGLVEERTAIARRLALAWTG